MLIDKGISGFSLKRIGIRDCFVEHGPSDILRRDYEVDSTAIMKAALEFYDGKKQ
jgi:1-deoxy-D-xylulose-5-phosphate synthase